MLKRFTYLTVIILNIMLISGCGEKEELTVFKEEMNRFYTEVSAIETAMQAIDEEDENAKRQKGFLAHLQNLKELYYATNYENLNLLAL